VKGSRGEPTTESGETKRDVLDEILGELRAIRSTLDAQQETTGNTSATTSTTGNAADEQSTGEDNTSQNEFVSSNPKAESSRRPRVG